MRRGELDLSEASAAPEGGWIHRQCQRGYKMIECVRTQCHDLLW